MLGHLKRCVRRLKSLCSRARTEFSDVNPPNEARDPRHRHQEALYIIGAEIPDEISEGNTTLRGFPIVPLQDLSGETNCIICLEPFQPGTEREVALRIPSCGHIFGSNCLFNWIETPGSRVRCPVCRTHIFHPPSRAYSPIALDTEHDMTHQTALQDLSHPLESPPPDSIDTYTQTLEEATFRILSSRTLASPNSTTYPQLSVPPTVSELITSYLDLLTRPICPTQEEVLELGADMGALADSLAPALRTLGLRAWTGERPGPDVLLDPAWRSVMARTFAVLGEAERMMEWGE